MRHTKECGCQQTLRCFFFKDERSPDILLLIMIFQDLSKTGLELIPLTLAGRRKWPWIRVVKIMGPVLAVPKCEQCLIRLCFTARPEGKVL